MVHNRFNFLLNQMRQREQRRYPMAEVARLTGLSRQLLRYWYADDIRRFDSSSIIALCTFLDCPIGDLLVLK